MNKLEIHGRSAIGKVFLVGAGPGDPGLLTLRGRDCLVQADIVLYDYLSSDALLRHANPSAERVCLGRHGSGKLWTQQQINDRIVEEAQAGRTVIRLKGGDPGVFGRLAEEVEACHSASIPYEVVPGVTTAMAAGAYAGVTLTDRDQASCVALVTGHERPDKSAEERLSFKQLASFPGTLVIYMGVTNAPTWSADLITGGRSPETPVTLVRRCSWPDQSTIDCTLADLPTVLAPKKVRPPLIAIVGDVVAGRNAADWFVSRPLFGKTVLVTRPQDQAESMANQLTELGARVLIQPTIEISAPKDFAELDLAIESLAENDYVVFSSRNGVRSLLGRMNQLGQDARSFGSAKVAAIGSATAEELAAWQLRADIVPETYRAEALAESLSASVAGKQVLLIRASRGREVLAESLVASRAKVHQVVAYQSNDVDKLEPFISEELKAGRIDWITATSSAIARSAVRLVEPIGIGEAEFAAISPLTGGVLEELGHPPTALADEFTSEGVVQAILEYELGKA